MQDCRLELYGLDDSKEVTVTKSDLQEYVGDQEPHPPVLDMYCNGGVRLVDAKIGNDKIKSMLAKIKKSSDGCSYTSSRSISKRTSSKTKKLREKLLKPKPIDWKPPIQSNEQDNWARQEMDRKKRIWQHMKVLEEREQREKEAKKLMNQKTNSRNISTLNKVTTDSYGKILFKKKISQKSRNFIKLKT